MTQQGRGGIRGVIPGVVRMRVRERSVEERGVDKELKRYIRYGRMYSIA